MVAGGEDPRAALDRGIQRGGVDERLEDGARLPLGQHVVQLADPVIAAADQRLDLAGVRIERDQRHLRLGESGRS